MANYTLESKRYLCCPVCKAELVMESLKLSCSMCKRSYPVVGGVPVLLDGAKPQDYRTNKWLFGRGPKFFRYNLEFMIFTSIARTLVPWERSRIIRNLGLTRGFRVMDHCTGMGGNIPHIAREVQSDGQIVAMDISREMVEYTKKMADRRKIEVDIHQADALELPYVDEYFDAVLHSGAFNQFGDNRKRVIEEMIRVTRPGGTIVIVDEGIKDGKYNKRMERFLLRLIPSFKEPPPVGLIPVAVDTSVDWVMGEMFYQIKIKKH
jgi:SAM-dependent methyltransferase